MLLVHANELTRKSLGDDDARMVLQSLIGWLIQCLRNREGSLVLRKLCSSLAAYFLQFSISWTRCIKHLLFCLSIDQAAPYQALEGAPETSTLIQNISSEKAVVAFWFAASLVEEVGKTDSNSMKQLSDFSRSLVARLTRSPDTNSIVEWSLTLMILPL